jgi:superfamily II DNA or RNA helicase
MSQLALLSPPGVALKPPALPVIESRSEELKPFEFQDRMVNELYAHIKSNVRQVLMIAPTGAGKAQPLDSMVLTPAGYKPMASLAVGDLVTGRNGYPCRVTGVFPQGDKEVYRVTMSDGSSTLCCDDHLWNVQSVYDRADHGVNFWRTKSLKQIRETQFIRRKVGDRNSRELTPRYRVPMVYPVQFFPVKEPLPFDAYGLGLLLGDGIMSRDRAVGFSCPDVQLQDALSSILPYPCRLTVHQGQTNDFDFRIVAGCRNGRNYNPMLEIIRSFGLDGHRSDQKIIPEMYLYASVNDRLSILQGLFDTDGCPQGSGGVEYVTTSKVMADQVRFLVQSLGGTIATSEKIPTFIYKEEKRTGQVAYRMRIKLPRGIAPFRLDRKAEKYNATFQDRFAVRRMIENIELVGTMPCQCISVDAPDQLYVTDDFIVTHNTFLATLVMKDATVKARKPIRCVFLVDLNCLIGQTVSELESFGVSCAVLQGSRSTSKKAKAKIDNSRVIVASLQTITARMKRKPLRDILGDVGLFFEDECHTTSQSRLADALREEYKIGTVFVGLTATPWLPGTKKWLGQKYDAKVVAPSVSELIRMGRVVPAQTFSIDGILDVQHLDIDAATGDFSGEQQANQIGQKATLEQIVSEWQRLGQGRSTVAYCPKVQSAKELAEEFNANGIVAEYQCGETDLGVNGKAEHEAGIHTRAAQDYRLHVGVTKVVCSVGTQTKGWNLKSLGCVMMVRATNSPSLFVQCSGRGSRTCDSVYWAPDVWGNPGGKKDNYILLDFGGNLSRFAPRGISPNTLGENPDRDYDISEPRQRKVEIEYKYCSECDEKKERKLLQFVKICPNCGHEFGSKDKDQIGLELDIELKEWFDEKSAYQAAFARAKRRACFNQNLSPDWASEEFYKKFGFIAPASWQLHAVINDRVLGRAVTDDDRAEFLEYLLDHQPDSKHQKLWLIHHFFLEFGEHYNPKVHKPRKKSKADLTAEKGWWTVLDLPNKRCNLKQLKGAYRKLAKQWHLDTADDDTLEKMKQINAAYEEGKKFLSGGDR